MSQGIFLCKENLFSLKNHFKKFFQEKIKVMIPAATKRSLELRILIHLIRVMVTGKKF